MDKVTSPSVQLTALTSTACPVTLPSGSLTNSPTGSDISVLSLSEALEGDHLITSFSHTDTDLVPDFHIHAGSRNTSPQPAALPDESPSEAGTQALHFQSQVLDYFKRRCSSLIQEKEALQQKYNLLEKQTVSQSKPELDLEVKVVEMENRRYSNTGRNASDAGSSDNAYRPGQHRNAADHDQGFQARSTIGDGPYRSPTRAVNGFGTNPGTDNDSLNIRILLLQTKVDELKIDKMNLAKEVQKWQYKCREMEKEIGDERSVQRELDSELSNNFSRIQRLEQERERLCGMKAEMEVHLQQKIAQNHMLEDENHRLNDDLDRLRTTSSGELHQEIQALEREREDTVADLQRSISQLQRQRDELESDNSALKSNLDELHQESGDRAGSQKFRELTDREGQIKQQVELMQRDLKRISDEAEHVKANSVRVQGENEQLKRELNSTRQILETMEQGPRSLLFNCSEDQTLADVSRENEDLKKQMCVLTESVRVLEQQLRELRQQGAHAMLPSPSTHLQTEINSDEMDTSGSETCGSDDARQMLGMVEDLKSQLSTIKSEVHSHNDMFVSLGLNQATQTGAESGLTLAGGVRTVGPGPFPTTHPSSPTLPVTPAAAAGGPPAVLHGDTAAATLIGSQNKKQRMSAAALITSRSANNPVPNRSPTSQPLTVSMRKTHPTRQRSGGEGESDNGVDNLLSYPDFNSGQSSGDSTHLMQATPEPGRFPVSRQISSELRQRGARTSAILMDATAVSPPAGTVNPFSGRAEVGDDFMTLTDVPPFPIQGQNMEATSRAAQEDDSDNTGEYDTLRQWAQSGTQAVQGTHRPEGVSGRLSPTRNIFTAVAPSGERVNTNAAQDPGGRPRPLNIDRNVDQPRVVRSYDNTLGEGNININQSPVRPKVPLTPNPQASGAATVMNNDPLAKVTDISRQNIYTSTNTRTGPGTGVEHPTPAYVPQQWGYAQAEHQPERTCPICNEDFPRDTSQLEFEQHVDRCCDSPDSAPVIEGTPTPPQSSSTEQTPSPTVPRRSPLGSSSSPSPSPVSPVLPAPPADGAQATDDDMYMCPVCSAIFPSTVNQHTFHIHVNSHFEEPARDFVIVPNE